MFSFLKELKSTKVEQGNGRVIALMNQKGGVGKTTMAFNLAHALNHQGKKVLCIDLDPQYNFSSLFGIQKNDFSIHHLLINSVKELKPLHTPCMFSDVVKTVQGIDILPSGQELSGFELTVAGINAPRQLILKKFLNDMELRSLYDVIVIDGPPTLGLLVVNILCAADGVLYPFIPDSFSEQGLKNIQQVLMDIDDMGITTIPKNLGLIPNLFESRRKQAQTDFDKIKKDLGGARIFEPFNNKTQFSKSRAMKKSVFDYDSKEYKEIQNQFIKMTESISQDLYS
jgi:chromosome partitioning protein